MLSQEINKAIIYSISMNYHLIFFLLKKKEKKREGYRTRRGKSNKRYMHVYVYACIIYSVHMHACVREGGRARG